MTLLDILKKLAGGVHVDGLIRVLDNVIAAGTDLSPLASELKAKFAAAIAAVDLAELGSAIPGELLNIVQGKIEPKDHPSDLVP